MSDVFKEGVKMTGNKKGGFGSAIPRLLVLETKSTLRLRDRLGCVFFFVGRKTDNEIFVFDHR